MRDLLQNEIKKKLEIGKLIEKKFKTGQLVDDEIVIDLVKKEMIKYEKDNVSYIVEGFPKNRVGYIFNNRYKECSCSLSASSLTI